MPLSTVVLRIGVKILSHPTFAKCLRINSQNSIQNIKILLGTSIPKLDEKNIYLKTDGDFPAQKRTNTNGQRLIDPGEAFDMKLMSINFKSLSQKHKARQSLTKTKNIKSIMSPSHKVVRKSKMSKSKWKSEWIDYYLTIINI